MDSTLTLIGSIVIGGIFLLGLMGFYGGVIDHSYEKTLELLTQETTASFMEIIEHDFRRIGSSVATPATAITGFVAGPPADITFLADVDDNGTAETVRYYTSDAAGTDHASDLILFREVNGGNTIDSPAGVTEFEVDLLDENGNDSAADWSAARTLTVKLTVESLYPYNGKFGKAIWEKCITPQNLYRFSRTNHIVIVSED